MSNNTQHVQIFAINHVALVLLEIEFHLIPFVHNPI